MPSILGSDDSTDPLPKRRPPYMGRIAELGIALTDLADDLSYWSQQTFGKDSERDPEGALKHLEKEAREALQAWEANKQYCQAVEEELADCLILVIDASRRAGMGPMALILAAKNKMVINKSRTWPASKPGEPCEHVKD